MAAHKFVENMARLGYAAQGTVYVIIGGFAIAAALGYGGHARGSTAALEALLAAPLGSLLLALLAIGLISFSAWRLLQGFLDADQLGRSRKALMRRTAYVGGALLYLGLSISAGRLLIGYAAGAGSDQSARDWTATLLSFPLGQWLVAIVGLVVAGCGIAIALRGWKERFDRLALPPDTRRWVVIMGRIGFTARGAVFILVAAFLISAAAHANAREARGLAGALEALQQQTYGWVLLGITAAGLFAFGAFQLTMAAFRLIQAPTA